MQINWFTVIAQILNFLVLVWLMKRYLYKPILNAIDERENKIKSQLEDAKKQKAEAKAEHDEFDKKNEEFDQQKKDLTEKAVAEANKQRDELLEQARNDANALRAKQEKASQELQEDLNHKLAQRTQQEVFAVARKAIRTITSQSLEEQAVNTFIKRLKAINKEEKDQFIAAFQSGSTAILIKSAFDLPEKQQKDIEQAVKEVLGAKSTFKFNADPALIGGIELNASGYKLSWSIAGYINEFEKSISDVTTVKPKTITGKKHHAIK